MLSRVSVTVSEGPAGVNEREMTSYKSVKSLLGFALNAKWVKASLSAAGRSKRGGMAKKIRLFFFRGLH